jgi:hypothetical protein
VKAELAELRALAAQTMRNGGHVSPSVSLRLEGELDPTHLAPLFRALRAPAVVTRLELAGVGGGDELAAAVAGALPASRAV